LLQLARGTSLVTEPAFQFAVGRFAMVFAIAVNPLRQLRDEVDRLFTSVMANPAINGASPFVASRAFPAVNIWEDSDQIYLEAEIPGVSDDSLDISVAGDELTIKGERAQSLPEEGAFHRRERSTGSFARLVRLPSEVAADRVQAALNDGVLLLTMPKAEAAKPRKIKVKSNT
jgi:HSP20 family protein